jgi:hypothetical protein
MFFFSFPKLRLLKISFQVFRAPTYTWQEGENTTPQQTTTTQGEQLQATITQGRVK